jgi:hypothetical protein
MGPGLWLAAALVVAGAIVCKRSTAEPPREGDAIP